MSNDATLYNVPEASNNFIEPSNTPEEYVYLATGVYRIPIPWFFCFDASDLHTFKYEFQTGPNTRMSSELTVPITSVEKAQENYHASKPLMQSICGDEHLGAQYWQKDISLFKEFDFDYITMDIRDLFHMSEWNDASFKDCFSRTEQSFEAIKHYSEFMENSLPYSVDEFYQNSELPDEIRVNNSAAIDSGFVPKANRLKIPSTDNSLKSTAEPIKKKWNWKFWSN